MPQYQENCSSDPRGINKGVGGEGRGGTVLESNE